MHTDAAPHGAPTQDLAAKIPPADEVAGVFGLSAAEQEIWARARPHLDVRNNDAHSLYAWGIARQLLPLVPGVDPDVVLPAILLHDTGWSCVPRELVLSAIAPGGGRPDLVRTHEIEGARIAREILEDVGHPPALIERITAIVDGHDSRREALSADDAVVKDADKIWRLTPHGITTVMGWFGLTREQAHRLCGYRVHDHLFTEPGRVMAAGFAAVASVDDAPERLALG
ncbi:HD domain-containing protein [Kocuria sp. LUK]|uniref:HD domain-containing protein n=1 Tax=Kocuria sp. LUK TaxID=2897828 RepID=UPI001E53D344|nr:HD domain-containing protein [Kocuria sp. LUK]MCD1144618.1 HD domain-containing protein [Kocuria sp. LUK]